VGEQFTSLIRPSERQPLEGIAHLAWLAFCSGPFLKSEGHRLTAPFPPENRKRYTDKTRLLAGPPDLPEQVEFYKTEGGSLLCAYYVLQSTNFYGWTVPVRFECEQYRDYGPDPGRLSRRVTATVTSIRQAPEPVLPAEVVRDLAQKNFD
jgi:hypothetical protein